MAAKAKPTTVKQYLDNLPPERRKAIRAVRAAVNKGLPRGYKEGIQYGMIGWFVPHSLFPAGYHCDPRQGVPFAALASQKNYMSLYLMCIYSDEKHRERFQRAWVKAGHKLNMGKSCVRFKNLEDVPLDVVTKTVGSTPVAAFLERYESALAAPRKKPAAKKSATKKKPAAKKKATAKKKVAKKASRKKKTVAKKRAR